MQRTGPSAQPWENQLEETREITRQFARPSFQERVVALNYRVAPQSHSNTYPPRLSTGGSRAASSLYMTHNTVPMESVPSLSDGNTRSASSLCTGDALLVRGYNSEILEADEEGALVQPVLRRPPSLLFQCCFHFLCCGFASDDMDEWSTHCQSHFRTCRPPRTVQCPYCDQFGSQRFRSGDEAWEHRMHHVANHHLEGYRPVHARPDFSLFKYLWQQKLITDAQLQELNRPPHMLSAPQSTAPSHFTVTEGSRREQRRIPDGQRQRGPRGLLQ